MAAIILIILIAVFMPLLEKRDKAHISEEYVEAYKQYAKVRIKTIIEEDNKLLF